MGKNNLIAGSTQNQVFNQPLTGFWVFSPSVSAILYNFKANTASGDEILVNWGDIKTDIVNSDNLITHPFFENSNVLSNMLSISSLHRWYDATDASTVLNSTSPSITATDGSTVTRWLDKSPNASHLNQTDNDFKPILKTNIFNGKPVIRFVAAGKFEGANLWGNQYIGSGGVTVFMVFQFTGLFRFWDINSVLVLGDGDHSWVYSIVGAEPYFYMGYSYNITGNSNFTTGSPPVTNKFNIYEFAADATTIDASVNGTSLGNTKSKPNDAVGNTLLLGAHPYNSGEYFSDIDVCELIIYNRKLTQTERNAVNQYLFFKYNIS